MLASGVMGSASSCCLTRPSSARNSVAGSLRAAIGDRLHFPGRPQEKTKAATSCGGCGPLAKQILDAEMK